MMRLKTIVTHASGFGPKRLYNMPYDIEGKTYYSIVEVSRLVGVPDETVLGWMTGRLSLNGLSLDVVRDADRNQYFISADTVRVLQHRNNFMSLDPCSP